MELRSLVVKAGCVEITREAKSISTRVSFNDLWDTTGIFMPAASQTRTSFEISSKNVTSTVTK